MQPRLWYENYKWNLFYFSPIRMTKSERLNTHSVSETVQRMAPSYTADRTKIVTTTPRRGQFSIYQNVKCVFYFWPSNSTYRNLSFRYNWKYTKWPMRKMFIALFVIAKDWKQPKCLSEGNWLNKSLYVFIMEYYTSVEKEREGSLCSLLSYGNTSKMY